MKIKLYFIFNIIFCFFLQNAFCEDNQEMESNDNNVIIDSTEIQHDIDNSTKDIDSSIISNDNNVIIVNDNTEQADNDIDQTDNEVDMTDNDLETDEGVEEDNNNENNDVDSNNVDNNADSSNINNNDNELQKNDEKIVNSSDNKKDNKNVDTKKADESGKKDSQKSDDLTIKKVNRIYASLMFTEENIKDIFKALPTSSIGIPDQFINSPFANNSGNGGNNQVEENSVFGDTSFSVYLNSIMYISPTNWAVWMNGNKITNLTNGSSDILVVAVSPLYVTFVWNITSTQWDVINEKKLIPETKYKQENGLVHLYFTLSPNQTYLPVLNKVLEGNLNRIIQTGQINTETEEKPVENNNESLFF